MNLLNLDAWAAEKQKETRRRRQLRGNLPDPVTMVQLPLWPEHSRAVPNGFLRSALFGVIRNGKRRFIKGEQIAALDGIEIHYRGERLDQGDLDVWENILHAIRLQKLGSRCRLTSYALLKLMGKTDTGKNRTILETRIERLRANALRIKQGRYTFIGGLIDEAYKDEETKKWLIVVNPKLRDLFSADQFTQVDWNVRRTLNRHPLAQWLDGFYASHAKPFKLKVETLQKLCGSETARISHFRTELRKAFDAVVIARKAHGYKFDYEIHKNDLVSITKKAKSIQRRRKTKRI